MHIWYAHTRLMLLTYIYVALRTLTTTALVSTYICTYHICMYTSSERCSKTCIPKLVGHKWPEYVQVKGGFNAWHKTSCQPWKMIASLQLATSILSFFLFLNTILLADDFKTNYVKLTTIVNIFQNSGRAHDRPSRIRACVLALKQ